MNVDSSPTPDEILQAILREEAKHKLGKLTIFFGMSAGVGKTYAMLEAAQQRRIEGIDVVVGIVNTHGRKETEELLQGLKLIPQKWVKYKDTAFEEFDVDAILALKPSIVLVDELAHSNVPGSKHSKRWQDVAELLDAGIDVYTTLNVQHVDSRKDLVEKITSISVRETVPDLLIERATTLTLIDVPPSLLLQRFKEGKVYVPDQSQLAIRNFFQEAHLTALREIALRFTAEKVDHDLHGMGKTGRSWTTRERLMVFFNHESASEQLIRSARRLAFELDAPWIAVYVNNGITLNPTEQIKLNRNIQLAQGLGAEVISTDEEDIAKALQKIGRQKEITRLIVAREKRRFRFSKSFIEQLQEDNQYFDILILQQDPLIRIYSDIFHQSKEYSPWSSYIWPIALMMTLIATGFLVTSYVGSLAVGLVILFSSLIIGLFTAIGPFLVTASIAALAWSYLFFDQLQNLTEIEGVISLFYLFTVSLLTFLFLRFQRKEWFYKKREDKGSVLNEIMKEIVKSKNFSALTLNVAKKLKTIFPGEFTIVKIDDNDQLDFNDTQMGLLKNEKERSAALWSFRNKKIAGCFTDTLPSADALFFPIQYLGSPLGVLVYAPQTHSALSIDELNLIQSLTEQLGIYLNRDVNEKRQESKQITSHFEKVQKVVSKSVTQELSVPIQNILTETAFLQHSMTEANHTHLNVIRQSCWQLQIAVDNLIQLAQIDSGMVKFDKKTGAIASLLQETILELSPVLSTHTLDVQLPPTPLLHAFDFNLMKTALRNLILHAMQYVTSKEIHVLVTDQEEWVKFSVRGENLKIPQDKLSSIFDQLMQPSIDPIKIGIGLTIIKKIAEIHSGRVEVEEVAEKGTVFSILIPTR